MEEDNIQSLLTTVPLVTHDSKSMLFKKSKDEVKAVFLVKDMNLDRVPAKGSRTVRAGAVHN